MYMKMTKGTDEILEPLQVCEKLDTCVRSRLQLWFYKVGLKRFIEMSGNKVRYGDVSDAEKTKARVYGFKSFVDGSIIHRYEVALSMSYVCVLHNEKEGERMNGFLKIFNKIAKEELALSRSRPEHMTHKKELANSKYIEYRSHEFSSENVRYNASRLKETLKEVMSVNPDEF